MPAVLAVLAFLLGGCFSEKELIERMTPTEDNALARKFIEAVRTGQFDAAREMLDPRLNNADAAKSLAEIRRRFLDHGEPQEVELVGYSGRKNFAGTESDSTITYRIRFVHEWVLARVQVERREGVARIREANFAPFTELEAQSAFTLRGKSPLHYGFLLACIGVPLFILVALVLCIRSRVRPKWVWIIVLLLGVCRFQLNWTTGAFDFNLLSVNLLGVGMFRFGDNAPWILSFSVPLGAIIFLAKRRQFEMTGQPLPLPGSAPPPPLPGPAGGPPAA